MTEFFIVTTSFAAPWFSEEDTRFQEADSPEEALTLCAASYGHPAGLYAAAVYASADAYHKREKPLARWVCNHEREKAQLTAGMGSYSYLGHGPGKFEINGELHEVPDPKAGSVVPA